MINQEQDMRNRIHRLEDKLLRCKDFQEQIRIHNVILEYRKTLQGIIQKKQQGIYS